MCWIDFHNGIWGCGLLCTLLISFFFTANTPRATTPHLYITGSHAEGYHAPSIPHGPPRLYHHCTAITSVYIPAITPRATTPHTYHHGPSRLCIHPGYHTRAITLHHTRTSGYHTRHDSSSYQVFYSLHFTGFYATFSSPTPPPGATRYNLLHTLAKDRSKEWEVRY